MYEIFKEHPINGIGLGQFKTKYKGYVNETIASYSDEVKIAAYGEPETNLAPKELMTHNDFLKVIAEGGLIGIFSMLVVFWHIVKKLRFLFQFNRDNAYLSISLTASILIYSSFHNNITNFMFWFILFLPFLFTSYLLKQNK